jgi:hypothetical protein
VYDVVQRSPHACVWPIRASLLKHESCAARAAVSTQVAGRRNHAFQLLSALVAAAVGFPIRCMNRCRVCLLTWSCIQCVGPCVYELTVVRTKNEQVGITPPSVWGICLSNGSWADE